MLASEWPGGQVHVQCDTGSVDHNATHIHICRPSSGQRSPARQLLAASVPYTVERDGRAARFLSLATYMHVTYRSQTDRLSCAANSLWHLLGRWSLWGHRMRSCQYRATIATSVHASATAWKWTGNKWAATNGRNRIIYTAVQCTNAVNSIEETGADIYR